jgi:ATP-dependent DNA helicase RecQ
MPSPLLLATLKETFGYDSFRPLQEEIIADALAGRDVFALLPTGGGKSLCFQLPALLREGLTVVVSPLIALMKDQVDALTAAGVQATFLNSTLDGDEARARFRGLHRGEYRLLYAAPERLLLPGFVENLRSWNVNQIAIDEAHCISEWGHDFRPEYRQLVELREALPDVPVMALTATATERVREDIVERLHLREPRCYVASFNRPNLTYRVIPRAGPYDQTLAFLRGRPGESGIIYCGSRKAAESVAERLVADRIHAKPYHAGLTNEDRGRHQDLFLRDEVRVICATIAFGMGINKPNVRFVLHYDLPKNLEGYYQETGRAGRDGLPAECVLLFSAADVVKQTAFIEEKSPEEQRVARAQLQQMVHFAESGSCRRVDLLEYFGEQWTSPRAKPSTEPRQRRNSSPAPTGSARKADFILASITSSRS